MFFYGIVVSKKHTASPAGPYLLLPQAEFLVQQV